MFLHQVLSSPIEHIIIISITVCSQVTTWNQLNLVPAAVELSHTQSPESCSCDVSVDSSDQKSHVGPVFEMLTLYKHEACQNIIQSF